MPHLQGIHADGWASQHACVLLRADWRHYEYLVIEGEAFTQACPMSLQIVVVTGSCMRSALKLLSFHLKERLGRDSFPAHEGELREVNIYADTSFSPQDFGVSGDTRALSYRVHKLALVDEQDAEFVLYSRNRAWLCRVAVPALVLWKSLLINHDIPFEELGRDLWQLGIMLHRPLPSRLASGISG